MVEVIVDSDDDVVVDDFSFKPFLQDWYVEGASQGITQRQQKLCVWSHGPVMWQLLRVMLPIDRTHHAYFKVGGFFNEVLDSGLRDLQQLRLRGCCPYEDVANSCEGQT